MRGVPFVDAHVHHWDLSRLRYPWLTPPFGGDGPNGDVGPIAHDYLPADYRAEAAGWTVAATVHVDAGADPRDALAETAWLSGLDDGPDAIVAHADLADPAVDALLAAHAAHPKVRGIRQIVNWHPDPARTYTARDLTLDPAWERGFARLAAHGLSFDLQAYPHQFAALADIIARHPGVPVAINHLGMGVDGFDPWRRALARLAALPNVAIKLSGFGFISRRWTAADAGPYADVALDLFGPKRIMVASDFPTDRLFAGFDATMSAWAAIVAPLTAPERAAVWNRTAAEFYRLADIDTK